MVEELRPLVPLLCCDIPSVYSNKQSYYECLCYIGYKVNECINAINGFTNAYQQYTDEKIAELKAYIDKLDTDIYKHIAEIEKNIRQDMDSRDDELNEKINKVQTDLLTKINKLNVLIYQLNEETKNHINTEIEKLYDYINEYVPSNMEVLNPVKGYYTSLSQALGDIYDNLRYYALMCNEFDSLNLTCDKFDGLFLSCSDFDLYGAKRFRVDSNLYMHSPFTGEYVFYQDVIYQLAEFHFAGPISVNEFDVLDLTVALFENKALTAYQFDSDAKDLLKTTIADKYGAINFTSLSVQNVAYDDVFIIIPVTTETGNQLNKNDVSDIILPNLLKVSGESVNYNKNSTFILGDTTKSVTFNNPKNTQSVSTTLKVEFTDGSILETPNAKQINITA